MKKSKQRFQAYVDEELFFKCKGYCQENEISISAFIEQLLSEFFLDSKEDSK
jgi:hypothetical protein